jgi:Transposase and inactivated derivatives
MLTKKGAPINSRQQKGLTIAQLNGMVQRIDASAYKVKSQSGNGIYDVLATELGWKCSCPDYAFRNEKCKHVFATEFSLTVRKTVEVKRIEQITNTANCIFCSSNHIVKDGIRHNKYGDIQKFNCKFCGHYFTINLGFERMRAKPEIITSAMQLYFTGESLRNVKKFLKMQGISKSHVAIYKWIKKYVGLMNNYLEQITPTVSDTWRADELYLKVRGNMKYLFALMDDETRFWIAQEVADTKYTHSARALFKQGKELMGKKPTLLITDGLPAYRDAFDKEYFSLKNPRPKHQYTIRISGDMNNNKMERLNGEVRDREKVMRGVKKKETPILKGYQIFHNYIRTHEGLNNKTPAEVAGITIDGKDKWKTIIENASKKLSPS